MSGLELQRFRRGLFRAVVLLPALMTVLALVLLVQIDRLLSVMQWVDRSSVAVTQAHRVRELLVNMEFSFRGYITTADPELIERYREAAIVFDDAVSNLAGVVSVDSPTEQQHALRRLVSIHPAWASRAESLLAFGITMDSFELESLFRDHEALTSVMTQAIASIVDSEHLARTKRLRERRETARLAVGIALFLTAVLGLLLAGFARRQVLGLSGRYENALADVSRNAEALRKSEELFRAMIEHAWDGFALFDSSGNVSYVSGSAKRILGYEPGEFPSRNVFDLVHPEDLAAAGQDYRRLLELPEVSASARFRILRKDGAWRWIEATAMNLLGKPHVGAIVANFRDITEQKQAEDERDDLLHREKTARGEAEAANRAKDEFLATLSHELRSPLNSVATALHLLRSSRASAEQRERALDIIDRSVRLQTRLIEDLLDVSRIVSGKLAIEMSEVDLQAVLAEATESARTAAEAKGVRFDAVFDASNLVVRGDSARLLQALGNILSNAIKFTSAGGEVRVRLDRGDSFAVIVVQDTGIGIRREVVSRIFRRFEQADASLTRRHGGLGLGLAIARHLVTLHGGSIEADSEGENRGATFRIRLPVLTSRSQAVATIRSPETMGTQELSGVRVLVVEDDEDARDLLSMLLSDQGATVAVAASVRAGLEIGAGFRPNVILTDLAMPDEDGFAFVRMLRRGEKGIPATLPVIAVTALASADDRKRALEAGFDLHLTKPVDQAEVITAVSMAARGSIADFVRWRDRKPPDAASAAADVSIGARKETVDPPRQRVFRRS